MTINDLRSYKIFELAIFDLSLSFIFIILLFITAWKIHFNNLNWQKFFIAAVFVTIPIGITFHVFFGVNTQLNYKLGLSNKPST